MNQTPATMTPELAHERVARGAALLDAKRPGWAARIDVGTLQLDSCSFCVLGQLEAAANFPFTAGLNSLGLDAVDSQIANMLAAAHGFARSDSDGRRENWTGWRLLQDAWIEAIADRLVASATTEQPAEQVQEAGSLVRAR